MNPDRGIAAAPARISVAMCTYNGARFLPLQLQSILQQTRLPDELVVCDDNSSDNTVAVASEFAHRAPFPVRIVQNATNLGSNKNFEQAIQLCTGDLIALSDQDDLWAPRRLEQSEAALRERPDCGLVFSDAEIIDDAGQRTGETLWRNFLFTPDLQAALARGDYTPLARYRFITGATVMFRAQYRPFLFPILGEWIHDGWIAMLIACLSGICFIAEPLVQYRQHAAQQVGLGNQGVRPSRKIRDVALRHWAALDAHRVILADVISAFDRLPIDRAHGAAADILRQHAFVVERLSLPAHRAARLLRILGMQAAYRQGASGWYSVAKDVALPKRPQETGAAALQGFSLFSKVPAQQD